MDKSKIPVMVVPRDKLFGADYFAGFKHADEENFEARILTNYKYIERGLAEQDSNFKQPIAYSVIVNHVSQRVFVYQRATGNKDYFEKCLRGKWSIGIGGHVETKDIKVNPISVSMLRELNEEVEIDGKVDDRLFGYINDDSNKVGEVHFGLLYLITTDANAIRPKAPEIAIGELKRIDEVVKMCSSSFFQVEDWSKIAIRPIEEYLDSLIPQT